MSRFPIKGDLSGYSDQQLNLICDVLEQLHFQDKEILIAPLGSTGDNFASDVRIIKVKVTETETFSIIVKSTPNNGVDNAMKFMTSIIFNNEITMYTEVLPMMVQLQEKAGVSANEKLRYPSCYAVSREQGHEVILLEDLSKEYTMLDKLKPLPHETVKLVLRNIACFHSLSYAIKNTAPEMFTEMLKKLVDLNAIAETSGAQNGLAGFGENISLMFDKKKYKDIVKELFMNHGKNVKILLESDAGSKYTVILHGDSWNNNILFKLKDNLPTECVMIDYQMSKEFLPVFDILYLIFNCTDYATRSEHFLDWIDYYHAQLEKYLFDVGLTINQIYPRDKFDSDLKRYAKASLGYAMITSSLLLRQKDEATDVREAIEGAKDIDALTDLLAAAQVNNNSMVVIKERLEGLIDSCIDFGYYNVDGV